MDTRETIKFEDDMSKFPEEQVVDALFERAKLGYATPDDVIVNADDWGGIVKRACARIEHLHGGKTFDDRWLFMTTIAGPFRLFGSPKVPKGEFVVVTTG